MYLDFNPETDLEIDRVITADRELVWQCWTQPQKLQRWLPLPHETLTEVRIDPRPGGEFYTRFEQPDGTEVESQSCILALGTNRFMAFSDGLAPGFRPLRDSSVTFALILGPDATGTRHILRALHKSPEEKKRSEDSNLFERWSQAITQLAEYANDLRSRG